MGTSEDVMVRINGQDNASSVFKGISQSAEQLSIVAWNSIQQLGTQMYSFATDCVQGAMDSETAWIAFGSSLDNVGGNFDANSSNIKSEVRSIADELGRSTGDVRTAMTDFMNVGKSYEESMMGVQAVSSLAALKNISFADAESYVTAALKGRGQKLKELGMDIENYKDASTGAIDTTKLFNDMLTKGSGAQSKYQQSTAYMAQQVKNDIAGLKTEFGQGLLMAIKPLIPVLDGLLDGFMALPGPLKTLVFLFGGALAAVGALAVPVSSLLGVLQTLGGVQGIVNSVMMYGNAVYALAGNAVTALASVIETGVITSIETYITELFLMNDTLAGTTIGTIIAADANGVLEGSIWGAVIAEYSFLIPLIAIIAAVAALVVAFELVGEYFGWWDDWGSMIDSIKAGVTELWNVFVNSPQVKGTIQDIQNAFKALQDAVKPLTDAITYAWNAIFNPSGGEGTADPLRDIVVSFGHFMAICGDVVNALKPILIPLGQLALVAIKFIATGIVKYFQLMWFEIQLIATVIKLVWQVANIVISSAVNGVKKIWNAIVNFINFIVMLPQTFWTIISQIPVMIGNVVGMAVGAVGNLASSMLSTLISGLSGIVTAVWNEFSKITDTIKKAAVNAVAAAKQWATDVVKGVLEALHIASPGIIQRTVEWEFVTTGQNIGDYANLAGANATKFGKSIVNGFNNGYLTAEVTGKNKLNNQGNNQELHFHFGDFNIDGRNFTTKECQQIYITAIEGLDAVKSVELNNKPNGGAA